MSFYGLTTKLEELNKEKERIVETTTIASISYLPVHLGIVKAKILSLAEEKPEWGIKVLEGENSKILEIENRLKIDVPLEHWDNFLTIFKDSKLDSDYLNLRTILNEHLKEVIEDDMKELRKKLKPALFEMFNDKQFKLLDNTINAWKTWFKISSYKTRENKGPVISQERKKKDIQSLYGKLLREYGDDKGNLEMLSIDIVENHILSAFDIFKDYDFLYGTRILSHQDRVPLIFEAMIDTALNVSQSIYVGNEEVLDKIEEREKLVKRVGNVLYPVGESFSFKFFRVFKDAVEDAVTDKEEEK